MKVLLGSVIDPLGNPLVVTDRIAGKTYRLPMERKAPGVIYREPVAETPPDRC